MGWRSKRRLLPGGVEGVFEEIALSEQHIRLAGNAPIRSLIELHIGKRRPSEPHSSEG